MQSFATLAEIVQRLGGDLYAGGQAASIPGTGHEQARVVIDSTAGDRLVDIRVTTLLTKSSGIWCLTAKGVRVAIPSLSAFIEAMKQAETEAKACGLLV